jgi:prepilin-type N-terminal cleavage/methylation domain-containing protein
MHTRPKLCGWAGRRAGVRGFSLVEILIAMAILGIGMVGVVAGLTAAVGLHKRAVDQTSAALLAETILELKQSEALAGFTPDELSTFEGGSYVFTKSESYPAYECKIICTQLNEREYKMILEVRIRPLATRAAAASDIEEESGNVRFETILLAGG